MIKYVQGDLFKLLPKNKVAKVIPHIVNDLKVAGSGFVIPLMNRWPKVREVYEKDNYIPHLGNNQYIEVESDIMVVNMFGQTGLGPKSTKVDGIVKTIKPIKYAALAECMQDILEHVLLIHTKFNDLVEIHAPMFGSLRAGGNWDFIVELIDEIWGDYPVYIYRLDLISSLPTFRYD